MTPLFIGDLEYLSPHYKKDIVIKSNKKYFKSIEVKKGTYQSLFHLFKAIEFPDKLDLIQKTDDGDLLEVRLTDYSLTSKKDKELIQIMCIALSYKFKDKDLLKALKGTKGNLVYHNLKGDEFFGTSGSIIGRNILGKLLTIIKLLNTPNAEMMYNLYIRDVVGSSTINHNYTDDIPKDTYKLRGDNLIVNVMSIAESAGVNKQRHIQIDVSKAINIDDVMLVVILRTIAIILKDVCITIDVYIPNKILFTNYYGNVSSGNIGNPISISRYSPIHSMKRDSFNLAPSADLLSKYKDGVCDIPCYTKTYNKALDNVDLKKVYEEHKGDTLYCYEKSTDFCHRHILRHRLLELAYPALEVKSILIVAIINTDMSELSDEIDNYISLAPTNSVDLLLLTDKVLQVESLNEDLNIRTTMVTGDLEELYNKYKDVILYAANRLYISDDKLYSKINKDNTKIVYKI